MERRPRESGGATLRYSILYGYGFAFSRRRCGDVRLSLPAMTIAVSALVMPSRRLRLALAAFAAMQLGAGLALAAGAGQFGPVRLVLAAACLLAAALLGAHAARRPKPRRIDISGLGELRLTVQQEHGGGAAPPLSLHPASTLWPQLLLLLLRDAQGAASVLAILPDSVAPDSFRALAVALRIVAGRDKEFFRINKIL